MQKGFIEDVSSTVKELFSSILNFIGDILNLLFGWI